MILVSDFGLAQFDSGKDGTIQQSWRWLSPEILSKNKGELYFQIIIFFTLKLIFFFFKKKVTPAQTFTLMGCF